MKKSIAIITGLFILVFTGLAHADFIGNKSSKFFFPDTCSYAKKVKKVNVVKFKTAADAVAAGYKLSSKCQSEAPVAMFIGNKDSKLFFPANCGIVKLIKDANKVDFTSAADATAAGYKASSKCTADGK
jgi:methylphosphotriester-DNA--protein-cysteine methyltransferase